MSLRLLTDQVRGGRRFTIHQQGGSKKRIYRVDGVLVTRSEYVQLLILVS